MGTFLGKEESWDDYIASKNGTVKQIKNQL